MGAVRLGLASCRLALAGRPGADAVAEADRKIATTAEAAAETDRKLAGVAEAVEQIRQSLASAMPSRDRASLLLLAVGQPAAAAASPARTHISCRGRRHHSTLSPQCCQHCVPV